MSTRDAQESLVQYVEAMASFAPQLNLGAPEGARHKSLLDFIVSTGEHLSKTSYTEEEEDFLLYLFDDLCRSFKLKACYENSGTMAIRCRVYESVNIVPPGIKIEYGEGWGSANTIPVDHAVLVINGKPVDLTWRQTLGHKRRIGDRIKDPKRLLDRAKYCLENFAYYMVRFPTNYACEVMVSTGTYGVIEFNKELLLKGKEAYT